MSDLAARLVVGLAGPHLAPAERVWLEHWQPAGVILFYRNATEVEALRRLIGELREVLPVGAEICADHEGGPVSFLQVAAGRPPAARTLGDLDDTDLTRRVHAETGRRLLSLGLDRVLAPCCDVLTEPRNPVIGARAFAADPLLAARHAAAAAAGLVDAGLRGCAKHWPGHGGSRVDTHRGAAAAAAQELAPFTAALAAGLDAVMVGHLATAPGRPPLSLDAAGLAELRAQLPAGALILSDDVSMGALREPMAALGIQPGDTRQEGLVAPADLPLAWLEAVADVGCDRLLLRGIPWRAFPLPGDAVGPELPDSPPAPDLSATGPDAAVYLEARRRAGAGVALRPGADRLLWLDLTAGDRLGSAAGLEIVLQSLWPNLDRLDAVTPRLAPGRHYASLLVTSHRPLTVVASSLLEPLTAAVGQALAAGHPSLADDLARLVGPGWRIDTLYDTAGPDLAVLGELV